ncbi:hypothetical protein MMC28_005603 [Mycoblastus sanguinarius]|nr:hypothetical protein [Mycoblastus sanguinarius]
MPFLQLRILPLEHVTVVISDNAQSIIEAGYGEARWTAAKKNELAEEIKVKLLDPHGADSLKAEEEAKKLELEGMRADEQAAKEARKKARVWMI